VQRTLRPIVDRLCVEVPDWGLLEQYFQHGDQEAFAQLVTRYNRLVWGQCRNLLAHDADAEDAFQATFLALSRATKTLKVGAPLGPWLHGVAFRVCMNARRVMTRRARREKVAAQRDSQQPVADSSWEKAFAAVAEEVQQLSEDQRVAFVLCYLEGRPVADAAAGLGEKLGTFTARLSRAKRTLLDRLAKRGLGVGILALGGVTGSAVGAPAAVVSRMLALLSSGVTVPSSVQALTQGVTGMTMIRSKLIMVCLLLGCAGFGLFVQAAQKKTDVPESVGRDGIVVNLPRENLMADNVAWGQEVDGLQAGLALVPASAHTYRTGETIKLEVRIRNVSKAAITIVYGAPHESAPIITDAKGGQVHVTMPPILGVIVVPTELVLQPGKTITLYKPEVAVEAKVPDKQIGQSPNVAKPTIRVGPGKYKLGIGHMLDSHFKLTTGSVEFEVTDPKLAAAIEQKIVWGKAVDGLQAGARLINADTVRIGEKAGFNVILRNVSKAAIKVSVLPLGITLPAVVDAGGNRVNGLMPPVRLSDIPLVDHTLQPGQTLDLGRTDFVVEEFREQKDAAEPQVEIFTIYVRPGKHSAAFSGFIQDRPALSTGSVEFEVANAQRPAKPVAKELQPFQGFWTMTLCDSHHEKLGIEQEEMVNWRWIVTGDEIVWSRLGEDGLSEEWKLSLKVDPSKSPKEIDLTYLSGPFKGEKCLGVYDWGDIDGKCLIISIQDPGANVPRPMGITMKAGGHTALITLRPMQPIDPKTELAALQGTWTFQYSQTDAWPIPIGKGPDETGEGSERRWVIKGSELTWTGEDGKEVKVAFTIDPNKLPKQIDFMFLNGPSKGAKCQGIYTLESPRPMSRRYAYQKVFHLWVVDPGVEAERPRDSSSDGSRGQSVIVLDPKPTPAGKE
jgi:RNA polymerase sigma factor (sigma-70 family)